MSEDAITIYQNVLSGKIKRFPRDFWTDDARQGHTDAALITRYLIEEVLNWDEETLKKCISCKVFFRNKLKGMLWTAFNDSVFKAINNAYPGKYHEWELACTPRNFWNKETAIQATIWLFREHLCLTDDQICQNISRKIFVENGLDTMLHIIYGNNASQAIDTAFPDLGIRKR